MSNIFRKANTLIEWTAVLGAVIAGLMLVSLFAKRPIKDKGLALEHKAMWDIWNSKAPWDTASNGSSGKANDTISFSEIQKEDKSDVTQVGRRTGDTKIKAESSQKADVKSLSLE